MPHRLQGLCVPCPSGIQLNTLMLIYSQPNKWVFLGSVIRMYPSGSSLSHPLIDLYKITWLHTHEILVFFCWYLNVLYFYLGLEFELEKNTHAFMSSNVLSLQGDFHWGIAHPTPEGSKVGQGLSASSGTRHP